MTDLYVEDRALWEQHPKDRWIYNRLALLSALGEACGPAGLPFPSQGVWYTKPIYNLRGMGQGRRVTHPDDVPEGYFWMPFYLGPHISVNYERAAPGPWVPHDAVQGVFGPDGRPLAWVRTSVTPPLPALFHELTTATVLNVEYIRGHVIEAHLRWGFDFAACPKAVAAVVLWDDLEPVGIDQAAVVSDVCRSSQATREGFYYIS